MLDYETTSTPATSGRDTQTMDTEPVGKCLAKYANCYNVTSQGLELCVHVWTLLRIKDGPETACAT